MKPVPFILLAILLVTPFLCLPQENKPAGKIEKDTFMLGNKIFSISFIAKSDYDSVHKSQKECCGYELNYSGQKMKDSRVKRKGDSLIFYLKNGTKKIYMNSRENSENGYAHFSYRTDLKFIHHWLISVGYFETSNYLLLNQYNGTETEIEGFCNPPCFSPDKKYFICGKDNGNILNVNSVYLFEMNNGSPTMLAQRELKDWGPNEFKWLDNKTILAKIYTRDDKKKYIRLEMKN